MYALIFFLSICLHFSLNASQVIYLNGTSSVGKTTIARALQDQLKEPYLRIGIDQMIQLMPEKVNNWEGGIADGGYSWKQNKDAQGHPLQILQVGSYAEKIPILMRQIVVTMINNGFNVIVDDVNLSQNASESWKCALKGFDVLWVGLTAPQV